MTTLRSCVLLATLTGITLPAFAEEIVSEQTVSEESTALPRLEAVIVTASAHRHERPLATTPAAVIVLEAADLAPLAALPAEEILARHAGVTLKRAGGPGQQTSLFLRGTDSDSTLVLVDGVKFNTGTLGMAPLQNLRGADIERIEVIRGPRSTLYGSEAIGGVILVTTRRSGTRIGIEAGSDDTRTAYANGAWTRGDDRIALGASRYRTGGFPMFDTSPVTGAHDNSTGSLNAATRFGTLELSGNVLVAAGSTRYLDTFLMEAREQRFDNRVLGVRADYLFSDQFSATLNLGHARDLLEQKTGHDYTETARDSLSAELRHIGRQGHDLVLGVAQEREDVDTLSYGTEIHQVNDNTAVFLHDHWQTGALHLVLGGRWTDYDSFGGHDTGEASLGYEFTPQLFGWLGWSRGFRAPDTVERYGFGGNPALKPEETDAGEIGLRLTLGRHEFTLTGFRQDIDELITNPGFMNVNVKSARITGTELGWALTGERTRLHAQLTLQDPVDESTDQQLLLRPTQQFSLGGRRQLQEDWWLGFAAQAMNERQDIAGTTLPGFATVDLSLDWQATRNLLLRLRVENIDDTDYALAGDYAPWPSIVDYNMPGRSYFLGLEWQPR